MNYKVFFRENLIIQDLTPCCFVLLRNVRSYLDHIETLREGGSYTLGPIRFSTPIRHSHPVETYGLKISLCNPSPDPWTSDAAILPGHDNSSRSPRKAWQNPFHGRQRMPDARQNAACATPKVISLIADTLFFEELASHYYQSDCLIINVVRLHASPSTSSPHPSPPSAHPLSSPHPASSPHPSSSPHPASSPHPVPPPPPPYHLQRHSKSSIIFAWKM